MKLKLSIHTETKGFTLVELAIVITIIGILIGGVLKGQQLIDQARLAATINQINNYRSALMIFKTTYNELPGDMRDPDARIVGCNGCVATTTQIGAANGFVGGGGIGSSHLGDKTSEVLRFWLHLYKADMITGVTDAALTDEPVGIGTTHPAAKINGGFIVETAGYPDGAGICGSNVGNGLWGECQPAPGVVLMLHAFSAASTLYSGGRWRVVSPIQAASIDRKLDDGRPLSGEVRGGSLDTGVVSCANDDDAYPEAETNSDVCTIGVLIEQ